MTGGKANRDSQGGAPRGIAAAELAAALVVLFFIGVAAFDYSRIVYARVTISNCARSGALYACDSKFAAQTPYTSVTDAALADAADLSPQPTVSSSQAVDSKGHQVVTVSVSYPFQTTVSFPGIPSNVTLTESAKMLVCPP